MKLDVERFMQATGNYKDIDSKEVFFQEVRKLIPLIQEELNELQESCNLEYVQGVLDDTGDIKVYVHQLESLLERLGCNVVGSNQGIAENNSLKYTQSFELAQRWLNEHDFGYAQLGVANPFYISKNEYDDETFYCLKRRDTDKVSKWCGFPKVDLDDFTPKEFGGNL